MALLIAGLSFLIVLPVLALILGSFLPTPPRALAHRLVGADARATIAKFSPAAASSIFCA